jgi:serine/threonine protein kinase
MGAQPDHSMLLRLYREFLQCCTVLTEKRINHFDIKCDNVMLDRFGAPALADFGESMRYDSEENCYTRLNKGTEWIKSPEMLSIAINSSKSNPKFDRRKKIGAGPASDVWSIGCLFFELMTGEFLFLDTDWSRFYLRITDSTNQLITLQNKEALGSEEYCKFLEFVLQRSVAQRPDLNEVIVRFDEMFPNATKGDLPQLSMPQASSIVASDSCRFSSMMSAGASQLSISGRTTDSSRWVDSSPFLGSRRANDS